MAYATLSRRRVQGVLRIVVQLRERYRPTYKSKEESPLRAWWVLGSPARQIHPADVQGRVSGLITGSRKFHVSDLFGGHSEFLNQHVTRLNDEPVLSLLADITTDQPDTAVDVVSDH